MRFNGTIYPEIESLPANAVAVSVYAKNMQTDTKKGVAIAYVYTKYKRFLAGTTADPGYTIRCFKGSNFVLPK